MKRIQLELFEKALTGNNYSQKTLLAYLHDVGQFVGWVEKRRVDWNMPVRFNRVDIVEFLSYLSAQNMTGVTRVRKLAAIRKYFTFLQDNNLKKI